MNTARWHCVVELEYRVRGCCWRTTKQNKMCCMLIRDQLGLVKAAQLVRLREQ